MILLNEGAPNESKIIVPGLIGTANSSNDSPGATGPDWAEVSDILFTLPAP